MISAILYARVSSKEQEAEGYSIPAQMKLLREYAAKNNFVVQQEFTDIETAKKAGRTQFSKMLEFIHENKAIKHILVEKTDRLLRNITDYALIDRLIEHSDITIHLVKENVILSCDSRSNEKFIFGIKALMAKNYVDNLSEETRKGMLEKAEQGIYPSFAPYGYINQTAVDGKKMVTIDPRTAPFIKRLFELYATGNYSLLTIKKRLLDEGMVYRNGKNFHKSTIETMLKNEFYTGIFYWKGKKYEHAQHEAIVSKELFQQVQNILCRPHKNKSRKNIFTYSGLLSCGICGCALTAEIQKGRYIYYHCTGHKGKCNQPYLKQETIEAKFEKLLSNIVVTKSEQETILNGLRASYHDKIAYHNACVRQLEKQIKILQDRVDQAYLDKLDKKISEPFWQSQTAKWLSEKEELTLKLLAHQKADTNYLKNANLIIELARKAADLFKKQNAEQKRRLINLLVSNSSYRDEKLDIALRSPFNLIMKAQESRNWLPGTGLNRRPSD